MGKGTILCDTWWCVCRIDWEILMSTMVFTEQGNTMNDHKNVVTSDLDTNLVLIENRLNKRCMLQQMIV